MTSIEDLIHLVESQPTCQTFADMLVDELIAQRDCLHTEARAHVELVQQRAISAAQLAEATNLMRADTRSGRILGQYVRELAGLEGPMIRTVILLAGDAAPTITTTGGHSWWTPGTAHLVTVGAKFVIDVWAGIEQSRKMARRYQAARRRAARRRE